MERTRRSGDAKAESLIFLHIPKTAGTTFNGILREVYGNAFLRIRPRKWQNVRWVPSAYRVVTGHMPWGVHERWKLPENYITFLRDPVERIISLWWHAKQHANHRWHNAARKMGVATFAQSHAFAELDNGMVRWLAGGMATGINAIERCVTETDYETALIHCSGMLIGTTETFKADVRRFARLLGWGKVPEYERRMIGKGRPAALTFTAHDLDIIRQANQWDCELYEMLRGK